MSGQPLLLVDGSSYLYRAFHALPSLSTKDGQPTGAVRGVFTMLLKLAREHGGSDMVVVFDAPGATFRDEIYDQYKANRESMPDELRAQIAPLHELVRAMGWPMVVHAGVEADDVIGTLAARAAGPVLIVTGDKDMAQLVDGRVQVYDSMKDARMDAAAVRDKFGVPPELMVDYLALVGDSSDNIPGVPGLGPKTAAPMLATIGDLDAIYADLDAVARLPVRGAGRLPDKLAAHRDDAMLSRRLARIKCDVDLADDEVRGGDMDEAEVRRLLERFEFRSLLAQMGGGDGRGAGSGYGIVEGAERKRWIGRMQEAGRMALWMHRDGGELAGFGIAMGVGDAAFVPMGDDCMEALRHCARAGVLLGHDLKGLWGEVGVALGDGPDSGDGSGDGSGAGLHFDVMLEEYLFHTSGRHDLMSIARRNLDDVPPAMPEGAAGAAACAEIVWRLHHQLWAQLMPHAVLCGLYKDLEWPLAGLLLRMEGHGALLDGDLLGSHSRELAGRLADISERIHALAGGPFNIDSTKQLQIVLYDKMQLPVLKKTPKGKPSTAEEVLSQLADVHEMPRLILEHRTLGKLKSTYTDKLPLMQDDSGRVHTTWHQTGTSTGRLSSSHPNLQNIPIRTAEGRRIREAFVAPPGHLLLAADYSQIELRIMAHLSDDSGLLGAFGRGEDVHRSTAAEVFGVPLEEVTDDHRRSAKAINFGLMYGMTAFGLGKRLGISRPQAQQYIETYFARYPGVQSYLERVRGEARERGYVDTIFGRRISTPNIKSGNGALRQAAERAAINAPMQGSAADIIKRAMLRVDKALSDNGLDARIIMQVHDELVLEVADSEIDRVAGMVRQNMRDAAQLKVPLVVDLGRGRNWNQAH